MADKKDIPKAVSFLVFPIRIKIANISHRNMTEIIAILAPIENIV